MEVCDMSELILQLPDEVLSRLQSEADRQQIPLDDLVRAAIESYLNDDEPTKDEILEGLRQSMADALAGRTYPADDLIAALRRKYPSHGDNR